MLMLSTKTEQTFKLTIELSEPVYRQLARTAALTHQSPEVVAAQSVTGNLPPSAETAPADMQPELLALQMLSNDELLSVAHSRVPTGQQQRHLELLDKNSTDTIMADEKEELSHLRNEADRLMLRKAYAWAILRWRGHRIPALSELSFQ
jgi:hypothetical protein